MLKRPLNSRFRSSVLRREKTTTIRDKAWPLGVPIMLYNWSGAAYRSKHIDVAEVVVCEAIAIDITRTALGIGYWKKGTEVFLDLWKSEGFTSQKDMDAWFLKIIKPGQTVEKTLIRFSRSRE